MKILTKILIKRFLFYFFVLNGIFSLIVISSQMLSLPSVFYHINIFRFLESLILINLSFFKLQLLFSFGIAFLLLGISIRENREIYAIYSSGISKSFFRKIIITLSILVAVFSALVSFYIVPKANRERTKFITVNVKKYFLDAIQPKNFKNLPGNYIIYISKKNKNNMKDILIYNKKTGYLITAQNAILNGNYLTLLNGIVQIPSKEGFSVLKYEKYIFNLEIEYLKSYSFKDFELKNLLALTKSNIKEEKLKAISVIFERIGYIIPFFFLGIIGFFLGISISKDKDFLLALFLTILIIYISINYYLIKLIQKGSLNPLLYIFIITVILFSISHYLYKKN